VEINASEEWGARLRGAFISPRKLGNLFRNGLCSFFVVSSGHERLLPISWTSSQLVHIKKWMGLLVG
jgi:hypothetical protein